MTASPAERNKALFLETFTAFAAGDHDVLRGILHRDFIEHSPGNPSGRDAFVEFIKASPVAEAKLDLRRVIADEDHVVAHYVMTPPGVPRGIVVADIWRMEDGLITERWDVVQAMPEEHLTPHGMV